MDSEAYVWRNIYIIHTFMGPVTTDEKGAWEFEGNKRGMWESLAGGRGREKYHNYNIISKLKDEKPSCVTDTNQRRWDCKTQIGIVVVL